MKYEGGIKYSELNLPFSYLTRYLLFLTGETSCFLVAAALLLLSQLSELKTILGGDTLYFQSSVNSMPASAAKPLRWAEIRGNILFHHATGNNIWLPTWLLFCFSDSWIGQVVGERLVSWGILVNPRILVACCLRSGWRPNTKYTDIGAFATQRNTPLCETTVCVKSVTSVTRELPDTSDRLTRAWSQLVTVHDGLGCNCWSNGSGRSLECWRHTHTATNAALIVRTQYPRLDRFKVALIAFVWLPLCTGVHRSLECWGDTVQLQQQHFLIQYLSWQGPGKNPKILLAKHFFFSCCNPDSTLCSPKLITPHINQGWKIGQSERVVTCEAALSLLSAPTPPSFDRALSNTRRPGSPRAHQAPKAVPAKSIRLYIYIYI